MQFYLQRALFHCTTARSLYSKFIQQTKGFSNKKKLKKELQYLTEMFNNSTKTCQNINTEYADLQEKNEEILTSMKAVRICLKYSKIFIYCSSR